MRTTLENRKKAYEILHEIDGGLNQFNRKLNWQKIKSNDPRLKKVRKLLGIETEDHRIIAIKKNRIVAIGEAKYVADKLGLKRSSIISAIYRSQMLHGYRFYYVDDKGDSKK